MRLPILLGPALRAPIENCTKSIELTPVVSYRHQYLCWACRCAGVLEFEPDASGPGWTECHHCGIDNEILPGQYGRPTVIPGRVPSRII